MIKSGLVFAAVLVTHVFAFALQTFTPNYYGPQFTTSVLVGKDEALKTALKKILRSGHATAENGPDQIVNRCDGIKNCYMQTSLGYDGAKTFLFGKFYLVQVDATNYGVKEMYCDRIFQTTDFKNKSFPGPGLIPDPTVINTEHTWPQSRFSRKYSTQMQKADLHHLFPTDSGMNSKRGSNIFGEVKQDMGQLNCSASRYGTGSAGSRLVFEPADAHKGHVARAIFYFSIRYDLPISTDEEVVLKKWNNEHPVDPQEAARNEEIFRQQSNRNPFIDYPELAEKISDF